MLKNTLVAAIALFGITVFVALSPVSASNTSFAASTGYLPEQIVNHGTTIETVPADSFGDTGLSKSFPREESMEDAAPQMYY